MLRKFLSFVAVVGVAFLWACDNGSDGEPSNSLIGNWSADSFSGQIDVAITFGDETITTSTAITGSDFDYIISFTESEFSTSGGYTVTSTTTVDGQAFPPTTVNVTNVTGSGTYTSTTDELTLSDSFFNLEVNGSPVETGAQPQTVSYTINGDQLTISQNETLSFTEQGITSSVTIVQSSTWTRQ